MSDFIKQFLDYLRVERGFSPMTIKAYENDLKVFSKYFNDAHPGTLLLTDLRGFLGYLERERANTIITRARKLSAIKSFFDFLLKQGRITKNLSIDLSRPKIPDKTISYLNQSEIEKLLEAVKSHATPFYGLRDASILHLFLGTGIRLSELVGLKMSDTDFESKLIKIRRKGNKEQRIPLNETAFQHLIAYLEQRPDSESQSLFINRNRQGLGKSAVYNLVLKYMGLAGIQKEKRGPHTLRHTVFTLLLNKGIDIVTIKELAGHRNIQTTTRYLHITDQNVRSAVNLLV